MADCVLTGGRLATMTKGGASYGLIENGALVLQAGRIAWVGPADELPADYRDLPRHELEGRLVTPGLIDCHTHLVYGGDRAREFELRLEGASYEEVAKAGGGILSTMQATREANEDDLVALALPRLDALMAEGVTTLEIKSGYGLSVDHEKKMLKAARRLGKERAVQVETTYLGAHALPPEYKGESDAYIDEVVLPGLESAAADGLVDAVDGFCENIAFSTEQIERVFRKARDLNLPLKLHAEQLSNQGGTELAAHYGALSADHLEYLDAAGVEAMAQAGTVAVLLPGAFYTLRETQLPPLGLLRQAGVPLALATDCNPGSSPLFSPLLVMNMACTLFRMTPEEALAGLTREGARALGLSDEVGTLEAGKRADLAIWDVEEPASLAYRIGFNPLYKRISGGEL